VSGRLVEELVPGFLRKRLVAVGSSFQHNAHMPVSLKTIAFLCLFAVPALARWEGPADNKPLSDLEQMDLKALFNEGFDVCVRRAVLTSGLPPDTTSPIEVAALDYLSVIEGVVRDKSDGKMPEWMRALGFARTTKECQNVFRGFISGELRDTRPAHASVKPTVAEETATPLSGGDVWVTATPTSSRKQKPTTKPKATAKPKPRPTAPPKPAPKSSSRPKGEIVDELPPWFRSR